MITSFEVGSVFTIVDKASPTILQLSRKFADLGKQIATIKTDLKAINDTSFAPLNSSFASATASVREYLAVLNDAAARTEAFGAGAAAAGPAAVGASGAGVRRGGPVASAGGGGGYGGPFGLFGRRAAKGGGGGGKGMFHTYSNLPGPGGVHARVYSGAVVPLGIAGYTVGQDAILEDEITQMFWHSGLPRTKENYDYFRSAIQQGQVATGFGVREVGETGTNIIRLLSSVPSGTTDAFGSPVASWKNNTATQILPYALRAAGTEARLKGTDYKGTGAALIQQILMTGARTPEEVEQLAPLLGFLGINNPASLSQMSRAASYALPVMQSGLGMNPADVLLMTTAIARHGATNSKSGTWVRSAFENALPPAKGTMSSAAYERRMHALRILGLVDANGKSTVLDATGHIDIDKFLDTESANASKLDTGTRASWERAAFGEQGERGLDLLKDPGARAEMAEMRKRYPHWASQYNQFLEQYRAQSPLQQMRVTWQQLQVVLQDIGQTILPPVIKALKDFDAGLKNLTASAPFAAIGAIAGFAVGGPIGAVIGSGVGVALGGAIAGGDKAHGADVGSYAQLHQHWKATAGGIPSVDALHDMRNYTKDIRDWLYNHIDYQGGGGGGPVLTPAMYTTSGGGGGGGYQPHGVASNPGSGVGRSIGTPANAGAAPMGNIPYSPAQVIGHLGGAPMLSGGPSTPNSWIAAQRAGFAKELQDPVFRSQFAAMLQYEGPTLGTAESVMNRALASGHSLRYMVTGPLGRAFYSTYGRILHGVNPAKYNALINQALTGTDTIRGFTDQGTPTDPNAPLGRHHYNGPFVQQGGRHGNIYNDWQAGRYAKQRKLFEDNAAAHAHEKSKEESTIPPSPSHDVHIHHTTKMNGRIVAQETVKHMVRQGNMQTVGTRLSDYSITRPMPV